jgi:hypothetical protein
MLPESTTLPQVHLLAYRSRETLRSQLKSLAREYSDRIKQLDNVMRQAAVASENTGDTLKGVDALSLSPDLQRLLVNPTHGL